MSEPLQRLLGVMRRLRDPQGGCAWDRAQTMASIMPHTLEEAHELAEVVAAGEPSAIRDELGDLLFQVVFVARIAEERGEFDFDAVATAIADKLERRHPHVFGERTALSAAQQSDAWEGLKAAERAAAGDAGVLAGVALTLPGLTRANKLSKRAARVGFDWPATEPVLEKLDEELAELHAARDSGNALDVAAEMGDVLFTCVNLARHLGVDAESALRLANTRFEQRFRQMELVVGAAGQSLAGLDAAALEALWQQAKAALR